jgi:hypothetical protein
MDRELAVICASPPGINPGMESVDLALLQLAEKYGFRARLQFYRLYPAQAASRSTEAGGISYSTIPSGDDFFKSKQAVIYWGDFLHMRQYHETVARKLVASHIYDNLDQAQARVRQVLLQSDQKVEILAKTLAFGGTLLFNTIQDEIYEPYLAALERFLKLCKAVWFRDVYSALKACQIRGTFQPDCLGVDCACLLDPYHILQNQKDPAPRDLAGLFLGRSNKNVRAMMDFAADVAKAQGCGLSWLNWGDVHAFPALESTYKLGDVRSLDSFTEAPEPQVGSALINLLKYRIVITDTYHLCVNAWNLGIPAICFMESDYSQTRNVNYGDFYARRDKRDVFMSMYDALDFLVPAAELVDRTQRDARLRHISEILRSGRAIDLIRGRIRAHAKFAESELMHVLSGLL